jgi:hypothetical protein
MTVVASGRDVRLSRMAGQSKSAWKMPVLL